MATQTHVTPLKNLLERKITYVSPNAVHNKRRREEFGWKQLFIQVESGDSAASVARKAGVNERTLRKKFRQFKDGNNETVRFHNQCKQIFTPEEEKLLAAHIMATVDNDLENVSCESVKQMAILFYNDLHPQNTKLRQSKFSASTGWVQRFKARWNFPSHKIKPVARISKQAENLNTEKIAVFKNEVVNALLEYDPAMVLNMDETPLKCVEMPLKGWNKIGSKNALKSKAKNIKNNITLMPTVTAAGTKLPLAWINKGKTDLGISRKTLPENIFSYWSESGWVNAGIMLRYLKEIVLPYTKKRPAALLLDNYGAHWEECVTDFCSKNKLRLIEVPEGETGQLQPLDVSVNAAMKNKRRKLYVEDRIADPDTCDSVEKAVWRGHASYDSVNSEVIKKGWKPAIDSLDNAEDLLAISARN
jgi:hypothetical protein